MTNARTEYAVSVAFATGADVLSWRVTLELAGLAGLERTLSVLRDLGHVAAYAVGAAQEVDRPALVDALRRRLGDRVLDMVQDDTLYRQGPPPAFLMPVWPFDHEVRGRPASTGRLLGLDLQLTATPTSDEEVGAHLPGRDGLWSIRADPMF